MAKSIKIQRLSKKQLLRKSATTKAARKNPGKSIFRPSSSLPGFSGENIQNMRALSPANFYADPGIVNGYKTNSETTVPEPIAKRIEERRGSGNPLNEKTQKEMGSALNSDFSDVRIHNDNESAIFSETMNAHAFTYGKDIYFNEGKYNPESQATKNLLAHELAHTWQNAIGTPTLHRKIIVAGKDFTPTEKYKTWLKSSYPESGATMVTTLMEMHKNGKPPEFKFASFDDLGWDLRIRSKRIINYKSMETPGGSSNGCCGYGSVYHLDPAYWVSLGGNRPEFKLKAGASPAEAVKAIFKPGAGTILECNSMAVAMSYKATLDALGDKPFNKLFENGKNLIIGRSRGGVDYATPSTLHPLEDTGLYDYITFHFTDSNPHAELVPGDWLYFKNFEDYSTHNPGGYWSGEWSVYLGNGRYTGFGAGMASASQKDSKGLTYDDLRKELLTQYNMGYSGPAKSYKDVPGFNKPWLPKGEGMAYRPNVSKMKALAPTEF